MGRERRRRRAAWRLERQLRRNQTPYDRYSGRLVVRLLKAGTRRKRTFHQSELVGNRLVP